MTFALRAAKAALTLPVLTAALALRWAAALLLVTAAAVPGSLLIPPLAIPSMIIKAQQRKHGDVPKPILRTAEAMGAAGNSLMAIGDASFHTADLLFGANPAWPPGELLPRRTSNPDQETLCKTES